MRAILSTLIMLLIFSVNINAQNTPPTIDSIITPYNNQIFSYPNIVVKIMASDPDDGIMNIQYKLNDSDWEDIWTVYPSDTIWSFGVDLISGQNTIKIRAIDSLNNFSEEKNLIVFYEIGNVDNWTQQNSGTPAKLNSVFFVNENVGWVVGEHGTISKTSDGGLSWDQQVSPINTDLRSVYFIDSNTGWAAGNGIIDSVTFLYKTLILKTTDGGNIWYEVSEVRIGRINTINFYDSNIGWVFGYDIDAGTSGYKTIDGGMSWENGLGGGPYEEIFSMSVLNTNNFYLVGEDLNHGEANYFHINNSTTNHIYFRDHSRFYDVEFLDENNGWIVGHRRLCCAVYQTVESVHILKSTNGGSNWIEDSLGIRGPIISADFIDAQTGWMVGNYGIIMHTTNGGEDWIEDGSVNGKTLNSVQFIDETVGYAVGQEGTILKYENELIPVELISLNASLNKDKVLLKWSTATEINNKGFEVYRKKSGDRSQKSEWNLLGYVEGKGSTTELNNYLFKDENPLPGNNSYKLKQIDFDGTFSYSNIVEVDIDLIPQKFELSQNYPNPFNPSTIIKYSLPKEDQVKLTIFSILGEEVRILVNEKQSPGKYEIKFDGSGLSNGIYFYKLESGKFVEVKKMVLIK